MQTQEDDGHMRPRHPANVPYFAFHYSLLADLKKVPISRTFTIRRAAPKKVGSVRRPIRLQIRRHELRATAASL